MAGFYCLGFYLFMLLVDRGWTQNTTENYSLLRFDPESASTFYMNTRECIRISPSKHLQDDAKRYTKKYLVGIITDQPIKLQKTDPEPLIKLMEYPEVYYSLPRKFNQTYSLVWPLQLNSQYNSGPLLVNETANQNIFSVQVLGLGYPRIIVHLIEQRVDNTMIRVMEIEYIVKAVRRQRTVDFGFNLVIMLVGIVNTFGIGCITDIRTLKTHIEKSVIPVCIAAGTQYIVTPLLTFGLVKGFGIDNEFAVGLLICSCIPGGGLGHLIVLITGTANPELSLVLNSLQMLVVLATAPLWMYSLGQFFKNGQGKNTLSTHYILLLCALLLIPYILGIITRHCKKAASEAVLNWLIKPLLLLVLILFITLGLYINMYTFQILDNRTFAMAGMIPFIGFTIGGGITLITMQGKPQAKTVGTEAAIMNCVVVIAATRFTMPQPDADLASAAAIAVLFLTPIPFICMLIFHKIKKKLMGIINRRDFEKEQAETIMQSFAAITNNALQMSGMTPAQVAERRERERLSNVDHTLPESNESTPNNKSETVVNYNSMGETTSVEALRQSNHRDYV